VPCSSLPLRWAFSCSAWEGRIIGPSEQALKKKDAAARRPYRLPKKASLCCRLKI
jgi:hypothetical protein